MADLSRPTCRECERRLLPDALCPFCHPQHFEEVVGESTLTSAHEPQRGKIGAAGVRVATDVAKAQNARGFLHVFEGANRGASMLLDDRAISIGRTAERNALALNDGRVSTQHCTVEPVNGGFLLRDTGSKNGTFVNDQQVTEIRLSDGDVVGCGDTRLYVGIL
jgi:hypothetical protein